MSKIIASAAIRGAHELVRQADEFFVFFLHFCEDFFH